MAAFKITKGIAAAGWRVACGDALRGAGKSLAVIMLAPTGGKPLTRIRISSRTAALEIRVHTSNRCTRGSWQKLDTESIKGFKAADWAKLTKFWAYRIAEIEQTSAGYDWASDSGKDRNRCATTAHCNAHAPITLQTRNAGSGGMGRGRLVKNRPNQRDTFGFSPASGKACRTHEAPK